MRLALLISPEAGARCEDGAAVALGSTEQRGPHLPLGTDADVETSLELAIAPRHVRLELAEAGDRRPVAALMATIRADRLRAASADGVLGDPSGASSKEGAEVFTTLAAGLVERCSAWLVGSRP